MDDLSCDELRYEQAPSAAGALLSGLVFYPVLALALGHLALRRAR